MSKQQHQVLARKWRPRQFADVVGQTHVVRALSNALAQSHLHHAYLFTGTRGVGKTTIARILAKCLNCESGITPIPCGQCSHCREIDSGRFVDLLEVDAASRTKVEDTRDLLDNVQYAPTKGRFKVYLIDEVHMLSGHSFNALLKTLEEPPAHVKFLLATTDPQKLPATVLSRCLQFHLLAMSPEQISTHCQAVLTQEHISFEEAAVSLLAKAADGSMRDALSLLDQSIAFGNGAVFTADVKQMLGVINSQTLYQTLEGLAAQDANILLSCAAQLAEQGADFGRALADLLSLLHQIAILQTIPNAANYITAEGLEKFAQTMTREDVQLYYQIGLHGQRDLVWAPTPRSGFEMALLRMLAFIPQNEEATAKKSSIAATPVKNEQEFPLKGTPPCTMGVRKGENRDSPPSFRAIGFANAQDLKPESDSRCFQRESLKNESLDWNKVVKQLPLDGATKMLAEHCALQEMTATQIKLRLHPKQKPLMNQKHIERIREAVTQYYGYDLKVEIIFDETVQETPANFARRQQETQQQAAEKVIFSDPVVQHMIQNFDATVIKASIHDKS